MHVIFVVPKNNRNPSILGGGVSHKVMPRARFQIPFLHLIYFKTGLNTARRYVVPVAHLKAP